MNLGDTVILKNHLGMGKIVAVYDAEFFAAMSGGQRQQMQQMKKTLGAFASMLGMEEPPQEEPPQGRQYCVLYNQPILLAPRENFGSYTEWKMQNAAPYGMHSEDELEPLRVTDRPARVIPKD
jgi:hypothetical protein